MTEAEQRLWFPLRRKQLAGLRFRRQHPSGPYVLDFVCLEHRLIVEVDGCQHGGESDARRDDWLESAGFRNLRVWNNDVLHRMNDVLAAILAAVAPNSPHPPFGHLPPQAGEGNAEQ
jgi:very-short-patch-repair endonuclease